MRLRLTPAREIMAVLRNTTSRGAPVVDIVYKEHDGTCHTVDVEDGMTLMEGAQLNMVPGIEAMCGGMCACATCHCYLDDSWQALIDPPGETELDMLKKATHRQENSRLSCQITVEAKMAGLTVRLPADQAE